MYCHRKKTVYVRGPNAYLLFARSVKRGSLDRKSYLKHLSEKWKRLSANEKTSYILKAKDIRKDPLKEKPRKEVIELQMKKIESACQILAQYGYIAAGMGFDPEKKVSPAVFGTPGTEEFFDVETEEKFRKKISGDSGKSVEQKETRKGLRKLVRQHFQAAWFHSTGSRKAVPYSDIQSKKISVLVHGMPHGVEFNEPSSYGIKTLKSILKAPVKFEMRTNTTDSPVLQLDAAAVLNGLSNSSLGLHPVGISDGEEVGTCDSSIENGNERLDTTVETLNETPLLNNDETRKKKVIDVEGNKKQKKRRKAVIKDKIKKIKSHDKDDVYPAKEILRERMKKGRKEFEVRWEGFSETTWEPQENIIDIDLLHAFYLKFKQ